MRADGKSKGTLITGVIGDDVHIIGMRFIEHALRDAGFKVVSLGGQVSQEEFINAAIETKADAILVSSLSGHANILVPGLRDKCTEAGLTDILLYLGGQLSTHDRSWEETEEMYLGMGINKVYPVTEKISKVIADLEAALERKS
jgi:methylaspartate mutase sigma subunit